MPAAAAAAAVAVMERKAIKWVDFFPSLSFSLHITHIIPSITKQLLLHPRSPKSPQGPLKLKEAKINYVYSNFLIASTASNPHGGRHMEGPRFIRALKAPKKLTFFHSAKPHLYLDFIASTSTTRLVRTGLTGWSHFPVSRPGPRVKANSGQRQQQQREESTGEHRRT